MPNSKKVRGIGVPTEYGSTVKNLTLGFFLGRPILGGYRSPTDFYRIGQNSEKYFFVKTSTIKSEKIYQTIHSASFIFICFGSFTIFLYFSRIYERKNDKNYEKITPEYYRYHSQILLNNFAFWDFSVDPRHVGSYGKIPNTSKSSPGGLW